MKILFGTDIVLSILNKYESLDNVAVLMKWANLIGASCYTDIPSIAILTHFAPLDSFDDLKFLEVFNEIKPKAYEISQFESFLDNNHHSKVNNYRPLLAQLNWLYYDADVLITNNSETQVLANSLQIDDKVFTIEEFIEKCSSENREKDDSLGVSIVNVKFGSLDFNDPFFNDFRRDYAPYYQEWFLKKTNDDVFIAKDKKSNLKGLLKLKIENDDEDYSDIVPQFKLAKRLKISSFKAHYTAQKLGQRFMRIVFETAIANSVDEIYVTVTANSPSKNRLIGMIEKWGFYWFGKKGKEDVYVRDFRKKLSPDVSCCFPYHSIQKGVFLLPIYRSYASQLVPPIQVLGECNLDVEPTKQAIRKVVVTHNDNNNLQEGSIILFYQKSDNINYRYIIGVGIVDHVYRSFCNETQFINRCKKRSTLLETSLHECWLKSERKPIVIDFLYVYHFRKNILNLRLKEAGIDADNFHSQHLVQLTKDQYKAIVKDTIYAKTFIVD